MDVRTRLSRKLFPLKKCLAVVTAAGVCAAGCGLLGIAFRKNSGSEFLKKVGAFSAALTYPEGGIALLRAEKEPVETATAPPVPTLPLEPPTEPEKLEPEPPEPEPTSSEPTSSEPEVVPESQPETSTPAAEPVIQEENKAALVHKTYTAAPSTIFIPLEKGFIKNCTSYSQAEVLAQIENPPYFKMENTAEPQVLIMHTHATESYFPFTGDYYDKNYSSRSTDNSKNMTAVGDEIAKQLESAGIGVIHDKTQHDYPSFNGAYDRSVITVQNYLKKYPSIKVVLDVHRDAIISGETVTAPVAEVNGKTAAQVMIINGCGNDTINYPDHLKNLSFSAALQVQMETDYSGLTRPILFDYKKYNQHLTTGSILLEIGGHGNTLEQALYTGELVGQSLGRLLNTLR